LRVPRTEVESLHEELVKEDATGSTRPPDWRRSLREAIADNRYLVHLVGVGNELKTDDAAGLEIASSLRARLGASPEPGVRIHAGTPMPERLLSKLASEEGRIFVFDAVEVSAEPGAVVFRSMADTKYGFFGTHNIPLKLVPGLKERLGDCFLVGVQPTSLEVGLGLSEPVRESVKEIVAVVAEGVAERS